MFLFLPEILTFTENGYVIFNEYVLYDDRYMYFFSLSSSPLSLALFCLHHLTRKEYSRGSRSEIDLYLNDDNCGRHVRDIMDI